MRRSHFPAPTLARVEGPDGRVWSSAGAGLHVLSPADGSQRRLGGRLARARCEYGFRVRDEVWFAGNRELVVIRPGSPPLVRALAHLVPAGWEALELCHAVSWGDHIWLFVLAEDPGGLPGVVTLRVEPSRDRWSIFGWAPCDLRWHLEVVSDSTAWLQRVPMVMVTSARGYRLLGAREREADAAGPQDGPEGAGHPWLGAPTLWGFLSEGESSPFERPSPVSSRAVHLPGIGTVDALTGELLRDTEHPLAPAGEVDTSRQSPILAKFAALERWSSRRLARQEASPLDPNDFKHPLSLHRAACWTQSASGDSVAMDRLSADLSSPDQDRRLLGIWALGRLGDATAIPALLPLLGESLGSIRFQAAAALCRLDPAGAVPALLRHLRTIVTDQDRAFARVLRAAARAAGPAVVPCLLERVESPFPDVRRIVLDLLGEIGGVEVVPGLVAGLGDASPSVRFMAAKALARRGHPRGVPELWQIALNGMDFDLSTRAVVVLRHLVGDEAVTVAIEQLRGGDAAARIWIAKLLGELDVGRHLSELVEALSDPNPRISLFVGLAVIGYETFIEARVDGLDASRLLPLLGSAEPRIRAAAAKLLGRTGNSGFAEALLPLLGDSNAYVLNEAFEALARLEYHGLVPLASKMAEEETKNADLRQAAVIAIGLAGDRGTLPLLVNIVETETVSTVACRALEAILQLLGPAEACRMFLAKLEDPAVTVRRAAAWALSEPKDTAAVPALMAHLSDEDDTVRLNALDSLNTLRATVPTSSVLELLSSDNEALRRSAVWTLWGKAEGRALPTLLDLVRTGDDSTRSAARGAAAATLVGYSAACDRDTELATRTVRSLHWLVASYPALVLMRQSQPSEEKALPELPWDDD